MRFLWCVTAVAVGIAAATSCLPAAGDPCDNTGETHCRGNDAVICTGGRWQEFQCASGCQQRISYPTAFANVEERCFFAGATLGTACPTALAVAPMFCASDADVVTCDSGVFRAHSCADVFGPDSISRYPANGHCGNVMTGDWPTPVVDDTTSGCAR
jgi:hypothetical protein